MTEILSICFHHDVSAQESCGKIYCFLGVVYKAHDEAHVPASVTVYTFSNSAQTNLTSIPRTVSFAPNLSATAILQLHISHDQLSMQLPMAIQHSTSLQSAPRSHACISMIWRLSGRVPGVRPALQFADHGCPLTSLSLSINTLHAPDTSGPSHEHGVTDSQSTAAARTYADIADAYGDLHSQKLCHAEAACSAASD